jgi:membrane-associated phospholipid phosphatase
MALRIRKDVERIPHWPADTALPRERNIRTALGALTAPWRRLLRRFLAGQERHKRILIAVQILYAMLFTGWLIVSHSWPAPDLVAIFLLLFALLLARPLHFLRDWTPFIVLVLGYIALTGIADGLIAEAHVQFPIDADRWLFHGVVPTLWLQEHLYTPGHAHWYDYAATFMYDLHFVVPLVLAFIFWLWRPSHYWRFVVSYVLLCYAGFVTYTLYPMAPPWWADRVGRLPTVHLILYEVRYASLANPIVVLSEHFQPNPVAAMPSLHAAFPVLVWLVLWRVFPRWGWAAIIYPLAMAFSVVYLGEHYMIDVLAGWLYGTAAFAIVWGVRWHRSAPKDRPTPPLPRRLDPVAVPVRVSMRR